MAGAIYGEISKGVGCHSSSGKVLQRNVCLWGKNVTRGIILLMCQRVKIIPFEMTMRVVENTRLLHASAW